MESCFLKKRHRLVRTTVPDCRAYNADSRQRFYRGAPTLRPPDVLDVLDFLFDTDSPLSLSSSTSKLLSYKLAPSSPYALPRSHPTSMSSSSQAPSEEDDEFTLSKISVHLSYSVKVKASGVEGRKKGKAAKPKVKIETKNKEMTFSFDKTAPNYLAFLSALLEKHGHDKYTPVTRRHCFAIRVLVPPKRAYVAQICFIIRILKSFSGRKMLWMLTAPMTMRNLSNKF